MSDIKEFYLVEDNDDKHSDTYPSFSDAVMNWEEGYTVYDADGVALYPEKKDEILATLRKGDKGNKVKAAQLLMIGYGFELQPFGADGNFGNLMEEKVNEMKKSFCLDPDGVIDIETWNKMLGGD